MADMVAAALRGDRAGATLIDQRLVALHRNLFVESNPIPVKWAVARMGLMGGTLRLPLTELSAGFHAIVTESLFAAGITVNSCAFKMGFAATCTPSKSLLKSTDCPVVPAGTVLLNVGSPIAVPVNPNPVSSLKFPSNLHHPLIVAPIAGTA